MFVRLSPPWVLDRQEDDFQKSEMKRKAADRKECPKCPNAPHFLCPLPSHRSECRNPRVIGNNRSRRRCRDNYNLLQVTLHLTNQRIGVQEQQDKGVAWVEEHSITPQHVQSTNNQGYPRRPNYKNWKQIDFCLFQGTYYA